MGTIGHTEFGVTYSFALEGFEPLRVGLSRFGDAVRDWRPFWLREFAPYYYGRLQRNFEQQGKLAGAWPPLSPAYAAWKAKHAPGKTILRFNDRLFRSLTFSGTTESAGPEGVLIAGRDFLELGTSVPYARFHQRGTRRMPRRPPLFLVPGMRSSIGRLMHRFAVDEAQRVGLGLGGRERVLAVSRFL